MVTAVAQVVAVARVQSLLPHATGTAPPPKKSKKWGGVGVSSSDKREQIQKVVRR